MWVLVMSLLMTQLLTNIWMCVRACVTQQRWCADVLLRRFYAKGQLCCTALRDEAAQACGAAASSCPANTLTMTCADLLIAIAAPDSSYPAALIDWTCAAFPNDNLPGDSLIVALIAIAVALPVSIFLGGFFEIANDSEAPESWLRYAGLGRLVCGRMSHHKWHYTGPLGQPPLFTRWYIRSASAPLLESLANAALTLRNAVVHTLQSLTCRGAPAEPVTKHDSPVRRDSLQRSISVLMGGDAHNTPQGYKTAPTRSASLQSVGDEAARVRRNSLQTSIRLLLTEEGSGEEGARATRDSQYSIQWQMHSHQLDDDTDGSSSLSGSVDQRSHMAVALLLRRRKRALTVVGLVSVAAVWAIMTWFILTYGLLIYELLGRDAQHSFTNSWGVSYGVGAATEWREVFRQAVTAIVILAIAERMHLTRPVAWLEEHIDYMSTSALLLEHGGLSFFQELRLLFTFRRRLSD